MKIKHLIEAEFTRTDGSPVIYTFSVQGTYLVPYEVKFHSNGFQWSMIFGGSDEWQPAGQQSAIEVLRTVFDVLIDFLKWKSPDHVFFHGHGKLLKVYSASMPRIQAMLSPLGYKMTVDGKLSPGLFSIKRV